MQFLHNSKGRKNEADGDWMEEKMKKGSFVMTKEKDKIKGITKFTVTGRVNSQNSSVLKFRLEDSLKYGETNIVLNMNNVEFLSSDGIRTILNTHKEAEKAGGQFRIEDPSEIVRNVLGMVALNELLI